MTRGSRERTGDVSILSKESEGEALRNVINKLSDLRDLHLKHLPHFFRAVHEEDDSLGHSWKSLRPLSTRGEDMPILQFK